MRFDFVFVLVGVISAAGGILGLLKLVQSLGADIDKFDTSTRERIKLLKPQVWGYIVQPPIEDLFEFCRSRIASKKLAYSSVADIFQDSSLQTQILDHLCKISLAYQDYKTALKLRAQWRNALRNKEHGSLILVFVWITTSGFLIVCGILGEIQDNIVYVVTAILILLWLISSLILGINSEVVILILLISF